MLPLFFAVHTDENNVPAIEFLKHGFTDTVLKTLVRFILIQVFMNPEQAVHRHCQLITNQSFLGRHYAKKRLVGYKLAMSMDSLLWVHKDLKEDESDQSFQDRVRKAMLEKLDSGDIILISVDSEEEWEHVTPPGDYE